VAALAAGRVREAISSEETLIVLVRPTRGSTEPPPGTELRLRVLGPHDGDLYARAIGTDSPATFRGRLTDATACYVVEDEGLVLHASWVTTECAWTRELRAQVCVGPGDAYVYESFTRSDARGRGVYPFALGEICRALQGRGVARLWVAVEANNAPSLKAVGKAGFERAFEIRYERRLGRLTLELPDGVKTDTPATGMRKNRCIWLSRDGAM
jgi:ribosomal protein S18 acetylase RimI-like enzyme